MVSVFKWSALVLCLVSCLAVGAPAPLPVVQKPTVTIAYQVNPGDPEECIIVKIRPGMRLRDCLRGTAITQPDPQKNRMWLRQKRDGVVQVRPIDISSLFLKDELEYNYPLMGGDLIAIDIRLYLDRNP